MLCRKKPGPVRRRIRKYIALLLILSVALTVYFECAVKALLREVIIRDMLTVAEQSVSLAVDDYLSEHADAGEKLSAISFNNGVAAAVTVDPTYVNSAKTFITERAQTYIDDVAHEQGIGVHLGSFTGMVFFANTGPEIAFKVDSTQTISCEFTSTFEGAGLNQTVHHVTLTVYVDLLIYNPFRIGDTVSTESTFEIAQTVIVGAVPTYGGVVSY